MTSKHATDHLIATHGGDLVDLIVPKERAVELKGESRDWPSWDLSARQLCDLELLLTGGFSPLRGFMSRADYEGVCCKMRLADGTMWPIPITLDASEEFARSTGPGETIALRDPEGVMLAVLHVAEVWKPDRLAEAEAVYGTITTEQPGVEDLLNRTHPWYIGGPLGGVPLASHY